MTIKHISFDMWNTLIKPNPDFARARNDFIAKQLGVSVVDVKAEYTACKQHFDRLALQYGISLNPLKAYAQLIGRVAPNAMPTFEEQSLVLMTGCYRLFHEHPPIMSNDTKIALEKAREAGFALSIGSNTNFISGTELKRWLGRDPIGDRFRFQMYSDVVGYAKPHWTFFQTVYRNVSLRGITHDHQEILHIGDDWRYDAGSLDAGFRFRSVADVSEVPQVLESLINGELE